MHLIGIGKDVRVQIQQVSLIEKIEMQESRIRTSLQIFKPGQPDPERANI